MSPTQHIQFSAMCSGRQCHNGFNRTYRLRYHPSHFLRMHAAWYRVRTPLAGVKSSEDASLMNGKISKTTITWSIRQSPSTTAVSGKNNLSRWFGNNGFSCGRSGTGKFTEQRPCCERTRKGERWLGKLRRSMLHVSSWNRRRRLWQTSNQNWLAMAGPVIPASVRRIKTLSLQGVRSLRSYFPWTGGG